MAQSESQSSDLVMGLFGFIASVVGATAVEESISGGDGSAWVLWILVVVGGGMVMGVAINNLLLKNVKPESKKAEPVKKATKSASGAKKKKVNG